jgi:outer membrane protein assembly factor BamB
MSKRIIVTECPQCGAPVSPQLIADPDNPSCPFCHTILPTAAERPRPVAVTSQPYAPAPAAARPGRHRGVAASVLVVFLVAIGVLVALVAEHAGTLAGGAGGDYRIAGPVVPVPASPGNHDFYVLAPGASDTDHVVLRKVDLRTHGTTWSTPAIEIPDGGSGKIVAFGTSVVVIADTTVLSFDASTGKQRWRSSLSNALASRASFEGLPGQVADCVYGCAIGLGTTLVTLDKDGTVQAFGAGNGQQLWSLHLPDTPSWMQPAGGDAAIVSARQPGEDQLLLFDPVTGRERTIAPRCAADGQGDTAFPSEDGGFFVSSDSRSLTVLVTGSGGCVANYRIADGALLWRTAADADNADIPFTLTGESAFGGSGYVAWTNEVGQERWVFAVSVHGGAVRRVWDAGNESGTTNLDGMIGTTLVAEVAPSYASDQPAIDGVSLASGKLLWALPARTPGDSADGNQTVVVTSTGIGIVSCQSTPDNSSGTCKFEGVDPTLGRIMGPVTISSSDILPSAEATSGPGGAVVADIDSTSAVTFDPVNGTEEGRWPS